MKYIQLKYNGIGRRTVELRTHGFMGPARSPMGKGPLKVADEYLRAGTLTTAFQLVIPPSGECQVVDCQHNRELLRKVTKPTTLWEEVKIFNEETGKYVAERQQVVRQPGFIVIDETPIEEDIVLDTPIGDSEEVKELKAKIEKLESKGGKKGRAKAKAKTPASAVEGEPVVPLEEDEPVKETAAEIKKRRFANKIADPVSLV